MAPKPEEGTAGPQLGKLDDIETGAQREQVVGVKTDAPPASKTKMAVQILIAVLCGLVFGTAVHKSGVFNATVLRDQFNFENSIMLQVFLSATATSIFVIAVMSAIPMTRVHCKPCEDSYREEIGMPGTLIGALLLGMGMTLAGACPGTVWVQLGSGSVFSLITIAGGLSGAALHGVVYDSIEGLLRAKPIPFDKASIADLFPKKVRCVLGFAMSAMLVGMVVLFDYLLPSHVPFWPSDGWSQAVWNPAFCGIMIGLLQIPLTLALHKNVGSASTMQTLVSMLFLKTNRYKQLNKMKFGMNRWWQVVYLICATSAAAIAVAAADQPWYRGDDITIAQAFVGGFIGIFGSRMAGGCTSGHGISGAGHLIWRSWAAVCAMFAGAIAVRYILPF